MLRDEPALELAECANAIYDPACERVIGTASNARVTVYDAQTGQLLTTLQEAHQSDSSLPARAQRHRRACVSPDNSMVIYILYIIYIYINVQWHGMCDASVCQSSGLSHRRACVSPDNSMVIYIYYIYIY